jgi:hypothetical protein
MCTSQHKQGLTSQHVIRTFVAGLLILAAGVATGGGPGSTHGVSAPVTCSDTIHGFAQARLRHDGALVVQGRVSGHGSVETDHVIINGVLAPGESPGCIDFSGNVTFNFTSVLVIEIGGLVPCTEHDQINVANTLTLNNPTLELVLIDGFEPELGDRFDILDWGALIGTFGSIDNFSAPLPYWLAWDTSELYQTGELAVVLQHIADGDLAPWNAPDGQINGADVLIATQLVLGQRAAGSLQIAHGDMNLDGVIDLADLLLIQQGVLQ